MTEPRFVVEIHGLPGAWTFISDHYFLGHGYSRGRFCWGHFLRRKIVFIQDRNKTGLCKSCTSKAREARKRRNAPRLGAFRGLSNAQKGKETARRIMELLGQNGKMSTAEMAAKLGMSRTAVSLHLRNGLADQVKRSVGPNRCAMWEAVA